MSKELLSFKATHKALGAIVTDVCVYEDRIFLKRKISGVLSLTVKLPSETTVYFKDISGVTFSKPTVTNSIGWIELSGINSNASTMKTVDVNGKVLSNVEQTNAMGNPYCIIFSKKEKDEIEEKYAELKRIFEEYKSNESNSVSVINCAPSESSLDKIKKLKELYDMGAISEEEFEKNKKELMQNL